MQNFLHAAGATGADGSEFLNVPDQGPWRAWHDFAARMKDSPEALAIRVEGRDYSYRELGARALALAGAISARETDDSHGVTAIYADRSIESYAGVLAALMLGHAYVPLNPIFPDPRNRTIVALSGASFLICSAAAKARAGAILDTVQGVDLVAGFPERAEPPRRRHDNPFAYILFTSGSTGLPKGVPITHANLDAYLTAANQVADFGPEDRFSQNFDLTFDVSVHDLFITWRAGGQLMVPSARDLERPADYVLRDRVTCWFSVPSLGQKMSLQGALMPGALAQLRLSFFVGEALPLALARAWQRATGRRVENWYGPTEATIVCLRYVLPDHEIHTHLDLTPIGAPLPGMTCLVVDEENRPVGSGGMGELLVAGPQVAQGYLNDPEKTAKAFVQLPGRPETWYRTGDRVILAAPDAIQFVDRMDNQIKIRGYRVEIGEIEAAIRKLTGGCNAIVAALPLKSANPTALVAAVEGWDGDPAELHDRLKEVLPAYMVPSALRPIAEFPRNGSGKADRPRICEMLAEPAAQPERRKPAAPEIFPVRRFLVETALRINPALGRPAILEAMNLMDAGMDSLAFTEFAQVIDKAYALNLDQDQVQRLSELPIDGVTRFIRKRLEERGLAPEAPARKPAQKLAQQPARKPAQKPARKPDVPRPAELARFVDKLLDQGPGVTQRTLDIRARRVIECLTHLPAVVAAAPHPLALFFGSSGTMNAVSAPLAEAEAQRLGTPVTAINFGTASLSNLGTAELVHHACEVIGQSGKPVAFAVLELEPAELSTLPYPAHSEIVANYLAGRFRLGRVRSGDLRGRWQPELGGSLAGPEAMAEETVGDATAGDAMAEAAWNRKREREDVETFLGRRDFIPMEIETWLASWRAISALTDRCLSFVHPILSPEVTAPDMADPENRLARLLQQISARTGTRIVLHTEFGFGPGDFRDYNHANLTTGTARLTRRLVAEALGQTAR